MTAPAHPSPTRPLPVRFLFLGQVRREKGVEHIVAAARALLEQPIPFHISIAGPVQGWAQDTFAPDFVARVNGDARLSAAISFAGAVEDVDGIFQSHDVHLAPSLVEESYGLVIVEAKINARPSIIYPSGGMIELVEHQRDGLICASKDSEHLAQAMLHFLTDPGSIVRMGDGARRSLEGLGLVRHTFNRSWANAIAKVAQRL